MKRVLNTLTFTLKTSQGLETCQCAWVKPYHLTFQGASNLLNRGRKGLPHADLIRLETCLIRD